MFHSTTNCQVTTEIAVVKDTVGEEETLPFKVLSANVILKSTQDRLTKENNQLHMYGNSTDMMRVRGPTYLRGSGTEG